MARSRFLKMALVVAVFGIHVFSVSPASDHCGDAADKMLFRIRTWTDLRKWFERFSDCDDGHFADGVSEYVTASLANRWSDLPRLVKEIHRNPQFEAFVLGHIDATADYDNLKMIVEAATQRCTPDFKSLCKSIADSARDAVAEIEH